MMLPRGKGCVAGRVVHRRYVEGHKTLWFMRQLWLLELRNCACVILVMLATELSGVTSHELQFCSSSYAASGSRFSLCTVSNI